LAKRERERTLGGKLGWLLGRAGPRGKEGGEGKEVGCRGKGRAERGFGLDWAAFLFSFLFFFPFYFLHSNYSNKSI
jgi:hypothetical protein